MKSDYIIRELNEGVKRIYSEMQRAFSKELNYLERQVLTTIFDKGEITSEETTKIINRSKPTAVKMLNKLKDMELIEWTGTSKSDTKGKYIIVLNSVK